MGEYRFRLSFRVRHPSADPVGIELALGLSAKRKWQAGEPRSTPKGTPLVGVYDATYCTFEIEAGEDSLPQALARSIGALRPHADYLRSLTETGGTLEYFIGWFIEGNSGDIFEPALMGELAELGIALVFDVYVGWEHDEESGAAGSSPHQ